MNIKTALVTGSSNGIGQWVATALARQSYRVILHGRTQTRLEQVKEEIKSSTASAEVHYIVADLSSMSQVSALAKEFRQRYGRLDLLINNAGGVMSLSRETTADGFEKTMALNLFAPFLLSELLLDLLVNSPHGQIINVSSNSHRLNAKPDFTDLELESGYHPLRAYGNSKLFLIWNTQYLAKRLEQQGISNVTLNSVHPGAVSTNFGVKSNLGGVLNLLGKMLRPFFKTAEQGAESILELVKTNGHLPVDGKYFENKKERLPSKKYYTDSNAHLVWEYCFEKTMPFRKL
ncbi:Short-chain dehydrogenase [Pedobacter sp. ok626]|uniref:SDR family NAD(P)-dependent oxidoreductase n=1 Tax=Pedobacter sp. ok626 TaxID=1761882 RepID=UPI0008906764|nr:SDR family NAD(P)-dependent oxidoreductase [Pedobacter sp. ok626]SDL11004.1 Short-chain dehydrogenase [Pedobacter sp. ok626]